MSITLLKYRELSALLASDSFRIYLLLALWVVLSLAWSGAEEKAISLVKRPIYVAALFIGVFFLLRWSERGFHLLLKTSAVLATLLTSYWLYKFISTGGSPATRFTGYGPSVNPVHFSQVLGFFFLYWFLSWWQSPKRVAWLELIGMLVFLIALVYTNSRSPFLGILFAILLIWAVKPCQKIGWVLIGLSAAITVFYLHPSIRILEPNTSYRFDVWREVFAKLSETPLVGHGYDTGIEFYLAKLNSTFTDTHSIHVGVLYELGVIGLIIWAGLYASLARDFFRSEKSFLVILSSCLVLFGIGSGSTDGMTYLSRPKEHWFLLWIPMSILVASVVVSKKSVSRPSLSS